jgi:hypothetical protein
MEPEAIAGLLAFLMLVGIPVCVLVVIIQKGHAMWLWWWLVPIVGILMVVYASTLVAKPGSSWFERYEPDGPKVGEAVRAYPEDAARQA